VSGPRSSAPELSARERILEHALAAAAARGPEALTLRGLAARMGLHNTSLLHHFGSRAQLLARLGEAVAERQREFLEPLAGDDPITRPLSLTRAVYRWARHLQGVPDEARLLLRLELGVEEGSLAACAAAVRAPLEAWLRRAGHDHAGARHRARTLVALVAAHAAHAPAADGGLLPGLGAAARALAR